MMGDEQPAGKLLIIIKFEKLKKIGVVIFE